MVYDVGKDYKIVTTRKTYTSFFVTNSYVSTIVFYKNKHVVAQLRLPTEKAALDWAKNQIIDHKKVVESLKELA